MSRSRVIAIFLDGYEQSLGAQLMDAGELPALAGLREKSACFLLDYGSAQRTGLAGEHFASGLAPEAVDRWAAVSFDPKSYSVWQEGTSLSPFPSRLEARTVVLDATYFDLNKAPAVRGVVGWGSHDPGAHRNAQPVGLEQEFSARFGPYPASEWTYGFTWPSAERSRCMGQDLEAAVKLRAKAARWLLEERLPDWDLAIIGVSETHSAIEALWHGIDPTHPLHDLPSAQPAGEGVLAVYRAVDQLVGELTGAFEDASVVVFAMGGMGANKSDVPSMALLPELLYRWTFGRELLKPVSAAVDGLPMLGEHVRHWQAEFQRPSSWLASRLAPGGKLRHIAASLLERIHHLPSLESGALRQSLDWMPAAQYRPYWRRMPAFALPSFYDGRVRINLVGREREGLVPLDRYQSVCDEVEALVRACKNPATGESVVDFIERPPVADPLALGPTGSDLIIVWRDAALALDHPSLGQIGPLPIRRTGGHTGPYGMAMVSGESVGTGNWGQRSSFDVVPTIIDLLGLPLPQGLSGASMIPSREVSPG